MKQVRRKLLKKFSETNTEVAFICLGATRTDPTNLLDHNSICATLQKRNEPNHF